MEDKFLEKKLVALMHNFNYWPLGGETGYTDFIAVYNDSLYSKFNLTDIQIQKAIDYFLFNGKDKYKKFPSVNDFLDVLGMSPLVLGKKGWVYTKKMIGVHGRYKSIMFGTERKHLALHATIERLGGWVDLCSKTYVEMERLEEKFINTFVDIFTTEQLKNETHLIGVYRTDPINLSISAANAIGYDKEARQSQLDRIKEEQMKKLNLPEGEE